MSGKGVTAILLLSCPDRRGLVAGISDFIFRNEGNIIYADQHTDPEGGVFLLRIEWELEGFRIPREEIGEAFRPITEPFEMTWELHFSDYVPRVAIFVSRMEHCLYDLLWRQRVGEFKAEIPLVVSNHPHLQPVAENFGVEYHCYRITAETKAT